MALPLNFVTHGSGAHALVVLHGFLGSSGNWHTLARNAFGPHFHVYVPDARNHGRSPHDPAFSYADMAADVEAFLDTHHLSSAFLLGHSMGGKTAMEFALTHPDRTRALIVVDMAPRAYPAHHDALLDALNALDLSAVGSRQQADEALTPAIPEWGVRQFLLKNLTAQPGGGYRWAMNLPVLTERYDEVTRAVTATTPYLGPTLFVRGEKSGYVRDADWPEITRLFPRARLVTIPDAGHWVHAEAPQALAETVVSFLLSHDHDLT